jgi:[CysO sulfur-carrier protein]-S-L-cysteine hydrolase
MLSETLHLSEPLRRLIIDHCVQALPNEGCGLIASDGDGNVVDVYPTGNLDESPTGYTVPPEEHFAALRDAESKGWELSGVFHSHPQGPAKPSMVDVALALDPEWIYLVVGIRGEPVIRAWRIWQEEIEEISLI